MQHKQSKDHMCTCKAAQPSEHIGDLCCFLGLREVGLQGGVRFLATLGER